MLTTDQQTDWNVDLKVDQMFTMQKTDKQRLEVKSQQINISLYDFQDSQLRLILNKIQMNKSASFSFCCVLSISVDVRQPRKEIKRAVEYIILLQGSGFSEPVQCHSEPPHD